MTYYVPKERCSICTPDGEDNNGICEECADGRDSPAPAQEVPEELGADGWRERMLFVSTELMRAPRPSIRRMSDEEQDLFIKAALALAEMFVVMDEKLSHGYMPPRAWAKDVPLPGELPSSDLHRTLKSETELIVLKMIERIEKRVTPKDKINGGALLELLGKLLSTLALFTSESVRLACLNNIKPEPKHEGPHLALVHDANPKEQN